MPGIRPPSPLTKGILDFLFENGPSTIDEIIAECRKYVSASRSLISWKRKIKDSRKRKTGFHIKVRPRTKREKILTGSRASINDCLHNLKSRKILVRIGPGVYDLSAEKRKQMLQARKEST